MPAFLIAFGYWQRLGLVTLDGKRRPLGPPDPQKLARHIRLYGNEGVAEVIRAFPTSEAEMTQTEMGDCSTLHRTFTVKRKLDQDTRQRLEALKGKLEKKDASKKRAGPKPRPLRRPDRSLF